MTTYASQVPTMTDYIASFSRTNASYLPSTATMTAIVRTSWTGTIPLTGQLWPRGRKV